MVSIFSLCMYTRTVCVYTVDTVLDFVGNAHTFVVGPSVHPLPITHNTCHLPIPHPQPFLSPIPPHNPSFHTHPFTPHNPLLSSPPCPSHASPHTHLQIWHLDGTVHCFSGPHLPLALFALGVLVCAALLALLLLVAALQPAVVEVNICILSNVAGYISCTYRLP